MNTSKLAAVTGSLKSAGKNAGGLLGFMNNLKVSTRIFGGFGIVLALLALAGGLSVFALGDAEVTFEEYHSLAEQANAVAVVQAHLLTTQNKVKDFIITKSDTAADAVHKYVDRTIADIEHALTVVQDPDRKAVLSGMAEEMAEYERHFDIVIDLNNQRNAVVTEVLEKAGPRVEKELSEIMDSAYADGDADAAYETAVVQRQLLLAELHATEYLVNNREDTYKKTMHEFEELTASANALASRLRNPRRRALAQDAAEYIGKYHDAFDKVHGIIVEQNTEITSELDVIGPRIAKSIESYEVSIQEQQSRIGTEAAAHIHQSVIIGIVVAGVSLVFGALMAWIIGTGISGPIQRMTAAMKEIAEGNKTIDVPSLDQKDEIGAMAGAVQVFKENALEVDRLNEEQAERDRKAEEEKRQAMMALADDFEASVKQVVTSVSTGASDITAAAQQLTAAAENAVQKSTAVADASTEASGNVQTVAAASEEMSSSIQEIARQVSDSTRSTGEAKEEVEQTDAVVRDLADAAQKIGEVVTLISDIAEQTNLLALNATIEAARAGESGKGFAVVASEVKNLAQQTAKATGEIAQQIDGVQSTTDTAVQAIGRIKDTIMKVDEIAGSISAAVEEQTAAVAEISNSTQHAARGTQQVNDNIGEVQRTSEETGAAARRALDTATDLSGQSEDLRQKVEQFLSRVRAA
jgi:methyl-accepting chemotaxis protein